MRLEAGDYITTRRAAELLGLDHSRIRQYIQAEQAEPGTGLETHLLNPRLRVTTPEAVERLRQLRAEQAAAQEGQRGRRLKQ